MASDTECDCLDMSSVYDSQNQLEQRLQFDRIETNGTYLAMIIKQMNDKVVPAVTSKVMPALNLAFTVAGWGCTVALGAVVLVMHLK